MNFVICKICLNKAIKKQTTTQYWGQRGSGEGTEELGSHELIIVEAGKGHMGVHKTVLSILQLCEHFSNKKYEVCDEEKELR